ncbi:MAG TPA: VOC family protein [Gaiellales bacterium]|jgi:catechol 2,3-dioxygenase-like lactoylglutathione lyase family enzyme|nr:VOC family protein [Gaiellales bacterium]
MKADRVSALVPFVHVADVDRSIAFYRLLGFEVTDAHRPADAYVWALLKASGARIMLARADAPIDPDKQAVLFYLYTRDLHALRAHLISSGVEAGRIESGSPGPEEEMRVTDPDGYCLMIVQIELDGVEAASR